MKIRSRRRDSKWDRESGGRKIGRRAREHGGGTGNEDSDALHIGKRNYGFDLYLVIFKPVVSDKA